MFQLGSRAIHWACRGGSLEVITALGSHGADLNVRDKVTHVYRGNGRNTYRRCELCTSVWRRFDPVTVSAGV